MTNFNDFCVEKCGNKDLYFIFDTKFSGLVACNTWTLDKNGYVCRNRNGKVERLHTKIIEEETGLSVPNNMYVDHINKCKTDNRLCNLRIVSPEDSARNMPIKSNNTSGITGVSRGRGGSGWRAYITVNKKRIDLGTYENINDAARVRYYAEEKYGFKHQQKLSAFLIEMEHEGKDGKDN